MFLKEERQQGFLAEQRVEDSSCQLSAAELRLEQAQSRVGNVRKEERQQGVMAEQESEELTCQLSAAVSELEQAQCLVEALKGEQFFSINELENLYSEHTKLLSKITQHEDEEGVLHHQFRYEDMLNHPAVSILEQKLQRARGGKEEARRMNRQFQEEKASRMALEKEREVTMLEVETQAALVITTLRSEILELRKEVFLAVESEATAKLQISHLQKEVETLQQTIGQLEGNDTRLLSEYSDGYRNLVDEKNAPLRGHEADLEIAISELIDHLVDGDMALTEAAKEIDEIKYEYVQEMTQIDYPYIAEYGDAAASMYHRLNGIHLMVRETEAEVRALSEAAAALHESSEFKSEDGEALIRESEKKSMVAFVMVGELLKRIEDLKSEQHTLARVNQEAYSKGIAKDVECAELQQQLEELRRQFAQLHDEHQLVVRKHEDLRQEHDKCSILELEIANDLKAENVRLEREVQDLCRALAGKEAENANLHEQLSDNHNQSAVMATDRNQCEEIGEQYQLLAETHARLQQEHEGLLAEKAMAAFMTLKELLERMGEMKVTNMSQAYQIQEALLSLAEKDTAAQAALQKDMSEDSEIARRHQVLTEANENLRQDHERQLVQVNVLTAEDGERAIKLSEIKAMAALVMMLQQVVDGKDSELNAENERLERELQDANAAAFLQKNAEIVSLKQTLEQSTEIAAPKHQVSKNTHDILLREEHERLQEEVLKAREGQQDGVQEEHVKVAGEEHKRLQDEDPEKSRQAHERVREELQKGREEHETLELENKSPDEHERSLGDNALSIEHRQRMNKLSEKKATGSLVRVEHLMEPMKVLKATIEGKLEEEIQENHLGHPEKQDTRLTVLERDLKESHLSQRKQVCDEHRFPIEKHEKLRGEHETCVGENRDQKQRTKGLELDLIRRNHFQEMSVTAEQQCAEVWTKALDIDSISDMRMAEREGSTTNVREGQDVIWHELSLAEEAAVDHSGSVERELTACGSQGIMLEEKNGGNKSAIETLQLEEREVFSSVEEAESSSRNWEEERATLVFEKEQSRGDYLEKEEKVQNRVLLEVQRLYSIVWDGWFTSGPKRVSLFVVGIGILAGILSHFIFWNGKKFKD